MLKIIRRLMRSGSRLMLFLIIYPILLNRHMLQWKTYPRVFSCHVRTTKPNNELHTRKRKKKADNLIRKKTWPPIEIFSTAAVQLLYPNSNASGIGKTFRKNFLQSKSLQIKTLSERARQGLCSDEDFDKTESAADKENGSDDDSDEENEGEAVAKKEKKRRQEAKCDMALLDPTGFAQEQLKKISGIYKDEKNVNKFKHVGTEVLKIVEEIINNYDSFIMNAIIPAKKNKTERDELTADIMREYKKSKQREQMPRRQNRVMRYYNS
uniref:Uncharacterized protein n=1 Tax=Meloidogyne enterolobii TaxID=390850 RepID=A0A6V7UCA0_MELEN|nr:unnamed protein product [Meloidogyne enterolobii]